MYQKINDKIFYNMLDTEVIVFTDDFLIYKKNIKYEHKVFVYKVFDYLFKYELYIVFKKI